MKKLSNLFKKLSITMALVCTLTVGGIISIDFNKNNNMSISSAEFAPQTELTNDLPEYFNISSSIESGKEVSKVDNTVYLFQNGSYNDITIATSTIQNGEVKTENGTDIPYENYYYSTDPNNQSYYYFDFNTSLSLFYDITNVDYANGVRGDNLFKQEGKDVPLTNYAFAHDNSFTPLNTSLTPKTFKLRINLNTVFSDNDDINEIVRFGEGNEKHHITLRREGIYTLVIPVIEYYTTNGGITFQSTTREICYNFMIFNANTYFDTVSGRPRMSASENVQESRLNSSSAYSTYYFYNFAYAQEKKSNEVIAPNVSYNTLPTVTYNPERISLRLKYSDVLQNTKEVILEYQNGEIVTLDLDGNVVEEKDRFTRVYLTENNETTNATVVFSDLGVYDITFSYLYTVSRESTTTIYNLNLESLGSDSVFKNKAQRLYIYGYQAMYSDYSNINPSTNQPENKDLKTYNDTNGYLNNADITSAVNSYILNNLTSNEQSLYGNIYNATKLANPTYHTNFNKDHLAQLALKAITNKDMAILPASTNQTPIKFLTNASNQKDFSDIYKLNEGADSYLDQNNNFINLTKEPFAGFNQNTAGTYLYVIQYKYDDFMSTSGTLQSAQFHYQIFYFTVTNTAPTMKVVDSNFEEVYTNGFTNKNVFILNNAENNIYDAKVDITLSAYDYNNRTYFFQDEDIKNLSSYGFNYQKFAPSEGDTEFDLKYNENIAGNYGLLIETSNKFANAKFTIKITSANSSKPSSRTFTIDTSNIKNINAKNVSLLSSTTYRVGEQFDSFNTNQPIILSWDEKASGARTYGYVTYIPTEEINYYSSKEGDDLLRLINRLVSNDILPVSYKIDLDSQDLQWTEYANASRYDSTIPSTYVKTNDGFYILEVYDQAGNSEFDIYLIDTTSPLFIQEVDGASNTKTLFTNGECISVPETGEDISIRWTSRKAIYIENIELITSFKAYPYGIDVESANEKLKDKITEFFKPQDNENFVKIEDINIEAGKDTTKIESYNGYYLVIPIEERVYIKDGNSSEFKPQNTTIYNIEFFDRNGNLLVDNATFKILLRDKSNTHYADNESLLYRNYPSGFISFNVTADASKMMIKNQNNEALDFSSFNFSGDLYYYTEDGTADGKKIYTHLTGNGTNDYTLTNPLLQYKFSYYVPTNALQELKLSFIPHAKNGSLLESVTLEYYPYVRKIYRANGNLYYYYDLSDSPTQNINVFPTSSKEYEQDEEETFALAIGSDTYPLAGKYVIQRRYQESSSTGKFDFFVRSLTIIIDNKNLVTPLESVTAVDQNGIPILDIEGKSISSLESLVGGDILLSFYSNSGQSSIEVSFPKYNTSGLNVGSFFTSETFKESDNLTTYAVSGNKLPISLYVPKYKYTIASLASTEENTKTYNLLKNNNLSLYGNSYYMQNPEDRYYYVYIEGVLVDRVIREQQAIDILNKTAIVEYQIFAEIKATVVENDREVVKYYYSDGTENNGYLRFYLASGKNGVIDKTKEITNFYQKGNYVITIYQASNLGISSSFYNLYKFGFEIISETPDFEIIGSDGYNLTATNVANTYYTNSHTLKIQWQVPTSEYEARIDENSIVVRGNPTADANNNFTVMTEGNTKYFTLDTEGLLNTQNRNGSVEITMQYEGYNRDYYSIIRKIVYFDKSMPTQNLQNLITSTELATQSSFTSNYQLMYMRDYRNYKNEEVDLTRPENIIDLSYSYSKDAGYFKFFSYNVNIDFFNKTLTSTIANASNNPFDTQFVYYRRISDIENYNQVDKDSFQSGNYYFINANSSLSLPCGFYEIVERDYAGNMTVYIVELTSSNYEHDANARTDALTYTNLILGEDVVIENEQIKNNFNIYSNSGFEIKDMNYQSDSWEFFTLRRAGESGELRFMKSPWIDDSQVYQVIFSTNGVSFNQVSLFSLFEDVESSSNKHRLNLANRITGENIPIYISVMDATLTTQKVEDPTQTSAILNITVPTQTQVESTTTSYVFPQKITISQFDNTIVGENKWHTIMIANQNTYGIWEPTGEYSTALSFISFRTLAGGTTLQVTINLGANASQKVKYDIVDNFGNHTQVIQLANEVSYREITGKATVYPIPESDGTMTYLSSSDINFSYNVLLYSVHVFNIDGFDITDQIQSSINSYTNIKTMTFVPTFDYFYDDYFKLQISDVESELDEGRIVHLRIYNKLPQRTTNPNDVSAGGIIFNDKNQQPIDEENIGSLPGTSVDFNGKTYTTTSELITTFSYNVTVRFYNGQNLTYTGNYNYQTGYPYSVYLSRDDGTTWENINSSNSDINGYTISGVGSYLIFIKYDTDEVFTDLCKLYSITILDSSTAYYYISVDGLRVEKSNVNYLSQNNIEYEINYIVSVDYNDKNNRLLITTNKELNVKLSLIDLNTTGSNVYVEIYRYECAESVGEFTIIYIAETSNIVTTFTYEDAIGTTSSIKEKASAVIVANKDTETNFNRLRLNFSSFYGIVSNKINVEVTKLFNGTYALINSTIYSDGNDSYIYLNQPGTYRIKVYDSCSPANVQSFNNNKYIDVTFLSSVPFTVTSKDENGDNIVTEPIQKAVYNGNVILRPTNLSAYYQASRMPQISVKRNGFDYNGYTTSNNNYTFTAPGYYTVSFDATSLTGVPVRTEEFNFTIVNQNESRYAYEFSPYNNYYIQKIEKDGVDITDSLLEIGNFPTITLNKQDYLAGITLNYIDEKTGGGRYKITVCPNNNEMINTFGESFTFGLWINMATPQISVSIAEGEKTTKNITISFNVQNLYNAVGDCYLVLDSRTDARHYNADTLSSYGTNEVINILASGTYYIQLFTSSGHLIYSYKVIRTEPLNVFAIIAIVIGCIAAVAVVVIFILLRKRQKVK